MELRTSRTFRSIAAILIGSAAAGGGCSGTPPGPAATTAVPAGAPDGDGGAAPDAVAGGEPTILMVPRDRCCDTPETCRELCGRGDPSACVAYGEMLVFANNRDTAVTPLATACDAHIASACTTLAAQLFFLDRMDEAFDVLRPLCAAGLPDECALFGELLGRAGRPDEALGPWSTACVADIGAACAGLGDALEARGTRGDADAVAGVLRPRCERNNDDACTSLGGLLAAAGRADESLEPLRLVCDRSPPTGCGALGDLLVEAGSTEEADAILERLQELCGSDAIVCPTAASLAERLGAPPSPTDLGRTRRVRTRPVKPFGGSSARGC